MLFTIETKRLHITIATGDHHPHADTSDSSDHDTTPTDCQYPMTIGFHTPEDYRETGTDPGIREYL